MLRTSFIIQLAKNLLLVLVAENAKIGSGNSDNKDQIVKKLLSKNLNKSISYLIPNAKKRFT